MAFQRDMSLDLSKKDTRLDRRTERDKAEAANERTVYRAIDVRDQFICRACGKKCIQTLTVVHNRWERHHIVPLSHGGPTTTQNMCGICLACHEQRHVKRVLDLRGDGDGVIDLELYGETWTTRPPEATR